MQLVLASHLWVVPCELFVDNQISDGPWRRRTSIRTLSPTVLSFLFLPELESFVDHRYTYRDKKNSTKTLKEAAMKLSVIRSACGSLRIHPARPGSRVGGLSRRCPPVGPPNGRLILRTASAASSGGTKQKLAVNFGKQSQNGDGFECDSSWR